MAETTETTMQDTQQTDAAADQAAEQPTQEQPSQDAAQPQQTEQPDAKAAQQADKEEKAEETKAEQPPADAAPDPKEPEAQTPPTPDAAAMKAQVIDAELRAAAALAGVPANKIPYVTRLADHAAAQAVEDPAQFAAAQIKQIVQDFPELAQQPAGTGSAGNHTRAEVKDPETEAIIAGFQKRL